MARPVRTVPDKALVTEGHALVMPHELAAEIVNSDFDLPRHVDVGHGEADFRLVVDAIVVGRKRPWLDFQVAHYLAAEGTAMLRPVLGLTVVAFGTSLPELATSLVAAVRGERSRDRSVEHELLVQETLLRATGAISG